MVAISFHSSVFRVLVKIHPSLLAWFSHWWTVHTKTHTHLIYYSFSQKGRICCQHIILLPLYSSPYLWGMLLKMINCYFLRCALCKTFPISQRFLWSGQANRHAGMYRLCWADALGAETGSPTVKSGCQGLILSWSSSHGAFTLSVIKVRGRKSQRTTIRTRVKSQKLFMLWLMVAPFFNIWTNFCIFPQI